MGQVWWLVDEAGGVVASYRAETALDARDEFKRQGLTGARVIRAQVAPVDETVKSAAGVRGVRHRHRGGARLPARDRLGADLAGRWRHQSIRAPDRSAERFMCMFCVGKVADGVSPRQQTLV